MSPHAASIELKRIFVDELIFKRNIKFEDKLQNVSFPFEFNKEADYINDSNHIICRIKARIAEKEGEKPLPFTFDVTISGEFLVKNPNDKDIESLREINCPAILFPFLREAIVSITTRAGYPPLYIPVFNFTGKSQSDEIEQGRPRKKKNSR